MSAIFGIIDFEGRPIDPAWIKSMQEDLAHRGPDGEGLYQDDSIVMGHKLLQVTPESIYDKSPYEEDGLVITANARLDEREAIMDRLDIPQTERETITDPLLLLRSFKKYGKDFVKDIYGDFAFAIWNKEKKELFCARDQMGVKPFLYYFQDGRFVFSTELKAIVKLTFVKTEVEQSNLVDKAIGIFNKTELTAWKNIYRLIAACTIVLTDTNIIIKQYWIPKYKRSPLFKTEEESSHELKKLLNKVITDHIRVIGNIGVPLSGGLDSSTIACLAARKLSKKNLMLITSSSVLNPEFSESEEKDESEYIQEVLKQETNIYPTFVYHTNLNFLENQDLKFEKHYSTINPNHFVDEALYNQFECKSIRRVLSGYLGDFTVSNSLVYPLPHLLISLRFKEFYKLFFLIKKKLNITLYFLITSQILRPLTPIFLLKLWHKIKGISPDFNSIPLKINRRAKEKLIQKLYRINNFYSLNISKNIWPTDSDPFYEDWDCGSSHHQIEMTYPLIDRRIIQFLLQIPVGHFYADGFPRGLIRMAMTGILPEKVRIRTDKGSYSPGFLQIIQKDILKVKTFLDNEDLKKSLDNLLDRQIINHQIEELDKLENYCNFTKTNLNSLYLSNLISFNFWKIKHKI